MLFLIHFFISFRVILSDSEPMEPNSIWEDRVKSGPHKGSIATVEKPPGKNVRYVYIGAKSIGTFDLNVPEERSAYKKLLVEAK